MIRFKNKCFEEYFIDPETGIITDKDGVVQEVKEYNGYLCFKGMDVHRLQVYTHLGYRGEGWDVHHLDENKHNNTLENLQYLEHREHTSLTKKGNQYMLGKHHSVETKKKMSEAKKGEKSYWFGKTLSEETRKKMSEALSGEKNPNYGTHYWNNGAQNKMCKECPGKGWRRGRLSL